MLLLLKMKAAKKSENVKVNFEAFHSAVACKLFFLVRCWPNPEGSRLIKTPGLVNHGFVAAYSEKMIEQPNDMHTNLNSDDNCSIYTFS